MVILPSESGVETKLVRGSARQYQSTDDCDSRAISEMFGTAADATDGRVDWRADIDRGAKACR